MNIKIDFTSLLECNLKNVILIVVDWLAKKQVYILCLNKNKETIAKVTAKMLLHNMWQKHGLLLSFLQNTKNICWIIDCISPWDQQSKQDTKSKDITISLNVHLFRIISLTYYQWQNLLLMQIFLLPLKFCHSKQCTDMSQK